MQQRKVRLWLLVPVVLMAFCVVTPAAAENWDLMFELCPDDLVDPPPIPVGCEVIDCCPGCPGPGPLDWRIRLETELVDEINLEFEGLSQEATRRLKIKGQGRWDGTDARIRVGDTTITGFSSDPDTELPVAFVRMTDEQTKRFLERVADATANRKDLGGLSLTVEQLLGSVVVNEFRLRYKFRFCPPFVVVPPPTPPIVFPLFHDHIDLHENEDDDSAVVVLDGRRGSGCVDDEIWRGNNIINSGNVLPLLPGGTCNSEVVVFSDGDAMQIVSPVQVWTPNTGDRLMIDLSPNLLAAPVSVWLVRAGALATAQADIANANLLYDSNHVGVSFIANYQNVSGNAAAVAAIGNNCTAANLTSIQNSNFYTQNQLNVYYISRPANPFTGFNCTNDTNIQFVGTTANNQTLAHEFGHSFSLAPSNQGGHTNVPGGGALAGFGTNNLMFGGGVGRTHISEGQAFRMSTLR